MRSPFAIALLVLALIAGAVLAACGDSVSDAAEGGGPEVVATTTQVADLVENVGAGRAEVKRILSPGADPHGYEPRPSDAAALADARLVLKSGGDLDEWLDDLIESAGGDGDVVSLIDSVDVIEGGHEHGEDEEHAEEGEEHAEGEADPHWWQDPRNAIRAVAAIRAALIRADPEGRATYERNARRYTAELRRLDAGIARCLDELPRRERKIVTTHDALGYFGHRYGVEIVGSVIPSLSTQAQPSAKDVAALVDQIRDERVKAIFPESGVSQRLESAISREADAEVGAPLWADTLGSDGSDGSTYLDAMAANTEAMVDGMSGGSVRCRPGG